MGALMTSCEVIIYKVGSEKAARYILLLRYQKRGFGGKDNMTVSKVQRFRAVSCELWAMGI